MRVQDFSGSKSSQSALDISVRPSKFPEIKHIYIRGNYRQDLFYDKVDNINAWNRIWLSAKVAGVEILAVEILSNHIHICIRIRTAVGHLWVSEFIHHLRMSLSWYFNHRYDVHGSFGSRKYGCGKVEEITVDNGEDLKDLIRYIIRNVKHHGVTEEYQKWPFSTFRHVFGLFDESDIYQRDCIPNNLLKAYLPASCKLPKNWTMTKEGMIVPPPDVFPRKDIETLFRDVRTYLKECNTATSREKECEGEEQERRLGCGTSSSRITDQEIIDFIGLRTSTPIVSMDRQQLVNQIHATHKAFPQVSLRQLSRIFQVPAGTIYYWVSKS